MERVEKIDLVLIDSSKNIREVKASKIKILADSIETHGLLQPIVIQKATNPNFLYEVVFGHSRLLAYKLLAQKDEEFKMIPAIIRVINVEIKDIDENVVLDTEEAKQIKLEQIKLSENLARNAMSREETARVIYKTLQTTNPDFLYRVKAETEAKVKIKKEDKVTLGNLAKKYGVSKSTIQSLNDLGKELALTEEKAKRKAEAEANGIEFVEDNKVVKKKIEIEDVKQILADSKSTFNKLASLKTAVEKIKYVDTLTELNSKVQKLQAFIKQTKKAIEEEDLVIKQREIDAEAKRAQKLEEARLKREADKLAETNRIKEENEKAKALAEQQKLEEVPPVPSTENKELLTPAETLLNVIK